MARIKVNYTEGTCFFVPLRDKGFARGIVSHLDRSGGVFGYFFGPRINAPEGDFGNLVATETILCGMFGDPALLEGKWPIFGLKDSWKRSEWPLPPLYREDEFSKKAWLSYYSEDNLKFIREIQVSQDKKDGYPYDRVMGSGAVEIRLTKMLNEMDQAARLPC